MAEKITREIAEQEVNKWLDHKGVSARKREKNKAQVETITDAIVDGLLTMDEKFNLIQQLRIVPEGENPPKELRHRPRITVKDINEASKGVGEENANMIVVGYASVITGKAKGIILALDSSDYEIISAIVIFFI